MITIREVQKLFSDKELIRLITDKLLDLPSNDLPIGFQ